MPWKGIIPSFPMSAIDKMVGQTKQTSHGVGKAWRS